MERASDFLAKLDSHGIYEAKELAKDFKASTGLEPCWPTFTVAATLATMKRRGLGGQLKRVDASRVTYGYEVAVAVAGKLIPGYRTSKLGRGSQFREAVEALKVGGF